MASNTTSGPDRDESETTESESLSRRPFLKATSVGLLGGGLAGCLGREEDDGDGNGGDGDGDGGDEGTPRATVEEEDLSGVEFDFWETRYYRESPEAEEAVQEVVADFEEATGASVNLNMQDDDQALIDAFNQGNQPPGYTSFVQSMGIWMQTGLIEPFSEYQDEFDYDVMESVGAQSEAAEFAFRGWDEGNTVVPLTANIFAPFVGRMDHFEEAGLDPDEDFPPESYEDLVETAQTLEEESSAQVGYQPIGGEVDNQDVYFNVWTGALGGEEGYPFNEDWSDLNVTTDTWRTAIQQNLDLWHEHGFGTPATPTILDEEIVPLHLDGRVAMSQQAPMNLPGFTERGGDVYEENIRWAPAWGGETGVNGRSLIPGGVLTKAPDDADEATWEEQQDAALELIRYFNSPALQVDVMPYLGFFPARRDIWPEISNDDIAGNFVDTIKEMAENAIYSYPAHPDNGTIMYDFFGVKHEQAFQGEKTGDEVLEETYEEGMEVVRDSQWG